MKLQVGERYRMRNGEIVGPLSYWGKDTKYRFAEDGVNGRLWNEAGKRYMKINEDPTDIIEHIPKDKAMSEQMVIVNCRNWPSPGHVALTLDEAERAGNEAKRIKAENEIKAGDFVVYRKEGRKVLSVDRDCLHVAHGNPICFSDCTKITNLAHIQALREIYEGMK